MSGPAPWEVIVTDALSEIDTVVMLMLENRSLDMVLGWLYRDRPPAQVWPPGSNPDFDGIPRDASNSYHSHQYRPSLGTAAMRQPCRVPRWDPNEPFEHVIVQLFGDANGTVPADPWSTTPTMSGFAFDFDAFYTSNDEVMGAYTEDQVPVLYGLAANFAVSDRWFASVPTQTDANRAFSVCGTSLGGLDNGTPAKYDARTIFNALSGRKSWGIYWQYDGPGTGDPGGQGPCYTVDIFPQAGKAVAAGEGVVRPYAEFVQSLAAGDDVPNFCYLEPFWGCGKGYPTGTDFIGVQGNDYHPPAWVGPAEHDLNVLYDALRSSKQWDHLLFIVTFDEHGGTWDHVPPPRTVAPDEHTERFDFQTLGVRVPTILVSPWVPRGTVFRAPADAAHDFDHTSLIATLLKWAGLDPASAGMGARVAVAPTFEGVLSATSSTASPSFSVPAGYDRQGGGLGLHLLDVALRGRLPIRALRDIAERAHSVEEFIEKATQAAEGPVPRTPADSGHPESRRIP